MTKSKIIIASITLLFLIAGMGVVKAQSSWLDGLRDRIGEVAGSILGNNLVEQIKIVLPESFVGAAGDTDRTARVEQIGFSTGSVTFNVASTASSTPVATLYNASGRDRIIDSVYYFIHGAVNTALKYTGTTVVDSLLLEAATSTHPSYKSANTNYVLRDRPATSTQDIYMASTTPGQINASVANRVWASGSYIHLVTNHMETTTPATGVFGIKYFPN